MQVETSCLPEKPTIFWYWKCHYQPKTAFSNAVELLVQCSIYITITIISLITLSTRILRCLLLPPFLVQVYMLGTKITTQQSKVTLRVLCGNLAVLSPICKPHAKPAKYPRTDRPHSSVAQCLNYRATVFPRGRKMIYSSSIGTRTITKLKACSSNARGLPSPTVLE